MSSNPRALNHILCLSLWAAMTSYGAETFSTANAVNDLGVIVGAKYTYSSQEVIPRATRWFRDLFVFDLGTLPGGTLSEALGVNNLGQVVGYSTTRDGSTHAFLWQRGVMQDLGTLGPEYAFSQANGINNRGEIVGVSCKQAPYRILNNPWPPFNDPSCRAFHWQNGVMRNLGVSPGGTFSSAQAINNRGQVVGSGDAIATDYPYWSVYEVRALIWDKGTPTAISPIRGQSCVYCAQPMEPGSTTTGASSDSLRVRFSETGRSIGSLGTKHRLAGWAAAR